MIGLLQRVRHGRVEVDGDVVGGIGPGLVVLVGVERGDGPPQGERLLQRLLDYRVFEDGDGRMNRSLRDTGGGLLLVPQFTLAADTRKGNRPSFTPAAAPEEGRRLFEALLARAREAWPRVAAGRFGAHMEVSLCNDGPVTFWLRVPPPGS
ncbi:D-aminoacyl-tRNA deacylase [Ectothiorhodospira mobilis]|uniref:D-aminoacyl-tRNA deacylase n=1 Tax=Ectothiorhodospira mobilis TaxID=195064 RepID=UPI0019046B63|nr:D-aminoacyl-tRNA deacylase [Ectothiorhodospira mobilis]MBK1692477.1 D-tyrosyl-tRNA(Tyr) deacylase [Ectothiorhodospira mobilis]